MSSPVVVNVAPAHGSVAKIGAPFRCSLRSQSVEVLRDTIMVYQGAGPSFYAPGVNEVLPEDHEDLTFDLFSLSTGQTDQAGRELVDVSGEPYLKIERAAATQEGLYRFGGLEAPAAPDAMLMLEFQVLLDELELDGSSDTGVLVGLKTEDKGVVIKFFKGPQAVEMWSADNAATGRPTPAGDPYRVQVAWSGATTTFKLLWNPKADAVRLYQQVGGTTTLLMDGAISDFGVIQELNRWANAPWAYFGHAEETGISRWKGVYLFNIVSNSVYNGLFLGEQEGVVLTDEVCEYLPVALSNGALRPWLPLPDVMGPLGGTERLDNNRLVLRRNEASSSIGAFREEPQVDQGVAVFDFTFSGELGHLKSGTQHTGMEFYIDTGAKLAKVALLYSGSEYVGLYLGGQADLLESYAAVITAWSSERTFRLVVDPDGQTTLYGLSVIGEGVEEQYLASVGTVDLPTSELPGPGLGFLHNALVSEATGALKVQRLRYSLGVVREASYPISGYWTSEGTGAESEEDGFVTLESTSTSQPFYYHAYEQRGDPENGIMVEFRVRVKSYSIAGEDDPIRCLPGPGVVVNDKTNHIAVIFAEAGPDIGKIVFLASASTDYEDNLLKIRAGDSAVGATYYPVDWSTFHLYRLHRTPSGAIRLYIDDADTPALDLDDRDFDYPTATGSQWQVRFGNVVPGALVKSQWGLMQYNVSKGIDLSVSPSRSENEVLQLFSHAFNTIVEFQDDATLEFSGIPGQFDTSPQDIEDFEEEW